MCGKTHLIFGLASGIALSFLTQQSDNLIFGEIVGASAIGSLFPDIDNVTSTFGKKVKLISYPINKIFGHRGFIHSPLFLLIIYFLGTYLLTKYNLHQYFIVFYGFIAGMVSHLFLDIMTRGGIPLFFPFTNKKYHILKVRTGGVSEFFVATILFCGFVYGFYKLSYLIC